MVGNDPNDDLLRYIERDQGDESSSQAMYKCGVCSVFTHRSRYTVRNHVESKARSSIERASSAQAL